MNKPASNGVGRRVSLQLKLFLIFIPVIAATIASLLVLRGNIKRKEELRIYFENNFAISDTAKEALHGVRELTEAEDDRTQGRLFLVHMIGLGAAAAALFFINFNIKSTVSQAIGKIQTGSRELFSMARVLHQAAQEEAEVGREEASAIQQTASSVTQVTSMIESTSNNCKNAKKYAEQCVEIANKGKASLQDLVAAVGSITSSNTAVVHELEKGNHELQAILAIIDNIGQKTKIIDDIVFQTKLLSFNASVEAARAGDYGKGFAVVSGEIGNLARMSGTAADEIKVMISDSMARVNQIVERSNTRSQELVTEGETRVAKGNKNIAESEDVLENIVKSVNQMENLISEVFAANIQQEKAVREIKLAMDSLNILVNRGSSSSQRTAQSASQLSVRVNELIEVVTVLEKIISGSGDNKNTPPSADKPTPTKLHFRDAA